MSVSMSKEKAKIGSLRAKDIIITAIIVIICVVSILPLYILIVNSTRAGQDITSNGVSLIPGLNLFKNIGTLQDWTSTGKVEYNALTGYVNSGIIALSTTFLTVLFS